MSEKKQNKTKKYIKDNIHLMDEWDLEKNQAL